jgi:hypothetical protein
MRRASCPAPKAALAYSGVPKAGEPDFMSTFEVKLPYMTGARGRTVCDSVMPKSASACASVSAPGIVTGAMAPASVKGVTIMSCPLRANSMMPSVIGTSSCNGELVLQMLKQRGAARKVASSMPWAMRNIAKQSPS